MADICNQTVLTLFQFDILMKNTKYNRHHKNQINISYKRLRNMYLSLCSKCQFTEYGSTSEEEDLVDLAYEFSIKLRDTLPLVKMSCELKNALTLMFCHQQKCKNLNDWHERSNRPLSRHFLNWISHRVSFIGHDAIGINNDICMSLGNDDPEIMWDNISECVKTAMDRIPAEIKIEKAKLAMRCYTIDFYIRNARCPKTDSGFDAICGESRSDEHIFRRELAEQLAAVLEDYVVSLGVERVLPQRNKRARLN